MVLWNVFIGIIIFLFGTFAQANFSFQGQIIKPDRKPLEETSVDFLLRIYSPLPSRCLLYQETHNINMQDSDGIFELIVGEGTQSGVDYADSNDINIAVNNINSQAATTCVGPSPYVPNLQDHRWLEVSFDDGGGYITLSQEHKILPTPYSHFAFSAAGIDGINTSDILQRNDGVGFNLNQANLDTVFSDANWTELQALLNGTSASFGSPSGSVTVDGNNDEIQLVVEGHSTQTTNLVEIRNSSSTVLATISSDGSVTQNTDLTTKNYVDTAISGFSSNSIEDGDGNTQIQVAESANDDTIRFDTAGNERMVIAPSGNVGIGSDTPEARLDVNGAMYSRTVSNAAPVTDIDFLSGNVQISLNTTNNAAFNLCGLKDGGSYTLILKAQPVGSVPTFSAFSDAACSAAIANVDTGNIPLTTTSATTLYTFVRAGNVVYVFIAPGFTM
jgi:hypothetical protein